MPALIPLAFVVIAAIVIFSIAVHILFSPWLLLLAIAVVAWIRLRPRRSQR